MAINRASIAKELLPGLNAVFGMEYGEVNNEHEALYEIENSDRAYEEEVLFTGFGTAPTKGEGASVSYDDAQESYTARYTAETVALAFAVTEEAMEDNLYDTFAKLRARGLARAMANTKQVKAANIYNNGFSDTIGDGAAFFSASHPTISHQRWRMPQCLCQVFLKTNSKCSTVVSILRLWTSRPRLISHLS